MQRKLKAIPAIILAFTLFFSQVALANGVVVMEAATSTEAKVVMDQGETQTKISREEAKKIATSFDFTKGYNVANIYLQNKSEESPAIWRIDLSTSADSPYSQYSNCTVSISADTGELTNYYSWYSSMNKKNIVTITRKEANAIADKIMEKIVKTGSDNLEVLPYPEYSYERTGGIYDNHTYSFSYAKKVNNILASNEVYSISIDASNGKISSFYAPYPYITSDYPTTEGLQDSKKLEDKFVSLLKMQLRYQVLSEGKGQKAMLVYYPSTPGQLNAKTMEPVRDEFPYGYSLSEDSDYVSMVPGAKVENKAITEEEGIKLIERAKLYLEKEMKIKFEEGQGSVMISGLEDQLNKSYHVVVNNKDYSLSVVVNLKTGNICYFGLYNYIYGEQNSSQEENKSSNNVKINYKEAKIKSDTLIKNLFPKQYVAYCDNNVEPTQTSQIQNEFYTFQYTRAENGIPVGNIITVTINKQTGVPDQINMNWDDVEFPSTDNIISADQAKRNYLEGLEFQLKYYTPYIYENKTIKKSDKTYIVFGPNTIYAPRIIDAKTGNLVDWSGNLLQTDEIDENHWAASSIEMLIAQGSLGGNISDADEKMTRQEAVKMLSLTMGLQFYNAADSKNSFTDINKDNEYYKYIENAVQLGIIKATDSNFNGTQQITKKEFITMLVNMLGYSEIVDKLFADKTEDSYITICKALDILPVKPGEVFNRYDTITLAEAAYSLQKALKYIR